MELAIPPENQFLTSTASGVKNLLEKAGFDDAEILCKRIILLVDALCNCREEGRQLFPQILISHDIAKITESIPFKKIVVLDEPPPSDTTFNIALKRAAPLATGSWSVFLDIKSESIRYGLISIESSILSPSLESFLLPNQQGAEYAHCFALVKNVGDRLVQIKIPGQNLLVDFSLRDTSFENETALEQLIQSITADVEEMHRFKSHNFIQRVLNMALPHSHGNLIGVLDCKPMTEEQITGKARKIWEDQGKPSGMEDIHWKQASVSQLDRLQQISKGVFLPKPIDILDFIQGPQDQSTDSAMRAYAGLIRNMLNNDGITIFDTKSSVLGYHIFIDSKANSTGEHHGGARTRAFNAMIDSDVFEFCFFKSQDGLMKFWEK